MKHTGKTPQQRTRENLDKHAEAQRRYKRRHPEMAYAAERRWITNNQDARRVINARASRLRNRRHPERVRARSILNKALRDGKIARPRGCFQCGSASSLQAHHHDYDKPLDVKWLCHPCHRLEHK